MNCHKLMYKPYRKTPPYEEFLRKEKEKQDKKKKQLFYQEIIKFRESRYPLEFLKILEDKINPFQLSLEKLKQVFSQKHPEYSNELVNESVEHIFNRKCQESQMIKESAIVIEYGDEYIRNGRKLIKEDFSFDFSNFLGNPDNSRLEGASTSRGKASSNNPENLTKRSNLSTEKMKLQENKNKLDMQGAATDRQNNGGLSSDRQLTNRQRAESPSKIVDLMKRTQRFNEILLNQIRKDKLRFENLDQIEEASPNDSLFYNYQQQQQAYTDRSKYNESLNTFREEDLLVKPDLLDTGRSQVEELNFLLSSLNFEEEGQETRRSKRSQNTIRINREVKEKLYNARGGLKLELVKRAIDQLKRQNNIGSANISRITSRN